MFGIYVIDTIGISGQNYLYAFYLIIMGSPNMNLSQLYVSQTNLTLNEALEFNPFFVKI